MKALTTEEFIRRARSLYGDTYDYSKTEYVNAKVPVTIICRKHGEFTQLPHNHLRGKGGCILCNKMEGRRLGIDAFLERAKAVHGGKYDYSHVQYVNSKTPVHIVCPVHGDFVQAPEKHMSGQGCPKCAPNYKDNTESFIEKARAVHGDFYDYSKVEYVDEYTDVCIVDPEYGDFWQRPNSHLNGRGDPRRKAQRSFYTRLKEGRLNKCEGKAYYALIEKFGEDDVVVEYWSEKYPFSCDFYIRSLDLYIEFNIYMVHGGHWFDSKDPKDAARLQELIKKSETCKWYKQYINIWVDSDPAKKRVAIRNNLNYLVFWKNDLSDFMDWLDHFDPEYPLLKNI